MEAVGGIFFSFITVYLLKINISHYFKLLKMSQISVTGNGLKPEASALESRFICDTLRVFAQGVRAGSNITRR